MVQSTCIRCGGERFEIRDSELKQKGTKVVFVQCADCGGVVGAFELRKARKWIVQRVKETAPAAEQSAVEL